MNYPIGRTDYSSNMTNATGFIQVDWRFDPPNLLEQTRTVQRGQLWLEVKGDGTATARLDGHVSGADVRARVKEAEAAVEDLLFGAQLIHLVAVSLKVIGVVGHDRNGTLTNFALTEGIESTVKFGTPDGVTIDVDTKQERIDQKRQCSQAVLRHRATDPTLARMRTSFKMALSDGPNELVYLYEVSEAFTKRTAASAPDMFKRQKSVRDRLQKICNDSEILQGRHRGKSAGQAQRDATEDELTMARADAAALIKAYLEWLEASESTSTDAAVSWQFDTVPSHGHVDSMIISTEHQATYRFADLFKELGDEEARKGQAVEKLLKDFSQLCEFVIEPTLRGVVQVLVANDHEARVGRRTIDDWPAIQLEVQPLGRSAVVDSLVLRFSPSRTSNMLASWSNNAAGQSEISLELVDSAYVQQAAYEFTKRIMKSR
ncbi:MAG: hypothetical protein LCI02_09530 [Proteobacteria bacterium]|nr:hypothetical protein [Pseudomonadota bacterium]